MPVQNPMTPEAYWAIRKYLPAEFEKLSHEKLTDLILNDPDEMINQLKQIKNNCDEVIHRLQCEDCKEIVTLQRDEA